MASKTFMEINGLTLVSDERDIMVPMKYRDEVIAWCNRNHIDVTVPHGNYSHNVAEMTFRVNLWRIKDEEQRLIFALRWS